MRKDLRSQALAALALAFFGLMLVELWPDAERVQIAPDSMAGTLHLRRNAALGPAGQISLNDAVSKILDRPLFDASRRPPAVAAAVAPAAAPPPSARLMGTLVIGDVRLAFFQVSGDLKPIIVPPGGTVADMLVQEISPDSVRAIGKSGVQTLVPTKNGDNGNPNVTPDGGGVHASDN